MSKEETIKNLKKLKSFHNGSYGTSIDEAIKALEQQPLHGYKIDFFSLGVTSWLSTFNTDSATACFTAVQELKKRLESNTDADNN